LSQAVRIFLARHGQTEWNLEHRFQGHFDSPLTAQGLEQSRRLANRLASEPLTAIYTSDLGRASATAVVVAEPHGLQARPRHELREIDCGEWGGLTWEQLIEREPETMERYRARPSEHQMPGGESLVAVQERAWQFLTSLWPTHAGQHLAVITHHIVVETLLARALELPLERFWRTRRAGNCALSVLDLEAGRVQPIVIYDGSHLAEAPPDAMTSERVA